MKRFVAFASVLGLLAAPLPAAQAQSISLMQKRLNSCGTSAFETVIHPDRAPSYKHKTFGVSGPTYVGEAMLEWCQHAQNAVIYFYVDDPGRAQHRNCPESMSLAIWPGRGDEVEQIIRNNVQGYYAPNVRVIEEPMVGPFPLTIQGRTYQAYKLEAVLIDSSGANRRQKMIGFEKDGAFVRIMTGVVEGRGCANDVSASFMASLDWPA